MDNIVENNFRFSRTVKNERKIGTASRVEQCGNWIISLPNWVSTVMDCIWFTVLQIFSFPKEEKAYSTIIEAHDVTQAQSQCSSSWIIPKTVHDISYCCNLMVFTSRYILHVWRSLCDRFMDGVFFYRKWQSPIAFVR